MDKDNVRASYRNTRSKFYNKHGSFDQDDQSEKYQSKVENTGDHWKHKGNQAFKQGKYDQAIQFYSKAIEMNPGESLYHSNRSKCYQKKGNYVQSLKDAEAACELNEHNIKAHYICGCILAQLGKSDQSKLHKAQNRLKKALRLCSTLSTPVYEVEISIRIFRLKKLAWLKLRQKQLISLKSEKEFITKSFDKYQMNKIQYDNIVSNIDLRFQRLTKSKEIPDYLICKITLQLMQDPVLSEGGFTYERQALVEHYKANGCIEPLTRKQTTGRMFPNQAIKQAIEQFLNDNPWAYEFENNEDYAKIAF